MDNMSKVYVKIDVRSIILCCEGGFTTPSDLSGWIQIDEGIGDKYNLCQSHYFDGGLYTDDGIPRYKLVNGAPVLRSNEEIESDMLEPVRSAKLVEISTACKFAINSGATIELSDGSRQTFSYSLEKGDQENLSEMFRILLLGADGYVYHQDNGDCIFYSAADIMKIYATLTQLKTHHTTYHNQLKKYVNSLQDIDSIRAVTYGQDLSGEYLDTYNQRMAEATEQIQLAIAKVTQNEA